MSNLLWKSLLASPAAVGAALVMSGAGMAAETAEASVLDQVSGYSNESVQLAQVTSVSELSDVRPTDWAYTALQRLVEEYRCIEGYPNQTFQGNRAMTRYEFAAGLNACLDTIVQLIGGGDVDTNDLATIRRLQEQFQAELATLRGRVDALEADVAELEANQFSTTTKLRGEVAANVATPFETGEIGGNDLDDSTLFNARARLNFDTSFTGEDRLRIRFQTGTGSDGLGQTLGFTGFEDAAANDDNDFNVDDFYYLFPVGNRIDVIVAANGIKTDDFVTSTIVPFDGASVADMGGPVLYDFDMGGSAGLGVSVALTNSIVFDAGYSFDDAQGSNPEIGIFGANNQSYIGQLSYLGEEFLSAALVYMHGSGDGNENYTDTYGGLLGLDFGRFVLGGYFAYHEDDNNNDDISYMGGISLPDLFAEGDELGIYAGVLPDADVGGPTLISGFDNEDPFYAEAYYGIPISEYLTITPSVIYLDGDLQGLAAGDDDEAVFGAIRALFKF
ncbi:MAG: iron uptake porin [Leptolyngbya sp. SIO4C5]|uniref:iron uptake porin n=1 Tax=Sphaerothrix gracilis TaxID=3151835 RepID=UPI0013BF498B|nr:iron uptake porin [Leptolyngbya sp. SIO4C5]